MAYLTKQCVLCGRWYSDASRSCDCGAELGLPVAQPWKRLLDSLLNGESPGLSRLRDYRAARRALISLITRFRFLRKAIPYLVYIVPTWLSPFGVMLLVVLDDFGLD